MQLDVFALRLFLVCCFTNFSMHCCAMVEVCLDSNLSLRTIVASVSFYWLFEYSRSLLRLLLWLQLPNSSFIRVYPPFPIVTTAPWQNSDTVDHTSALQDSVSTSRSSASIFLLYDSWPAWIRPLKQQSRRTEPWSMSTALRSPNQGCANVW